MLPHLLRRIAASVAATTAAVLGIALAASSVRLMPWLVSPTISWPATSVFARLLVASAVEVAFLVSIPTGVALSVWRLTTDQSARTLHTVGVGPLRIAAHAALVAAAAATLLTLVSAVARRPLHAPGRVSNHVVQAARSVCASAKPSSVPGLGWTWLCVERRPTLVGVVGQGDDRIAWSASDVTFSDDLSAATFVDVTASSVLPRIDARVRRVAVTGFAPWIAPSAPRDDLRALALWVAAIVSSAASAWSLLLRPARSQAFAFVVGMAGPVVVLAIAGPLMSAAPPACIVATTLVAMLTPIAFRHLAAWTWLSGARSNAS